MNNIKNETRLQKVNAKLLHTGLYYQNEPNKERVSQIVSNFDWNKFEPMVVSYRDGKNNVIDGQHRLCSARVKFGDNVQVPCHIRFGLTEEEEMELFINLVKSKRKVHSNEIYKAWYGSGNIGVVEMVNSIREIGLICDFSTSKTKNRITGIHGVYTKMYKLLGKDDFKMFLDLIKNTWNGEKESLNQNVLMAVLEFIKLYRFDFDSKTFIKQLSKYPAKEIEKEVKMAKQYSTNGVSILIAKYNKGLKQNKRLELK